MQRTYYYYAESTKIRGGYDVSAPSGTTTKDGVPLYPLQLPTRHGGSILQFSTERPERKKKCVTSVFAIAGFKSSFLAVLRFVKRRYLLTNITHTHTLFNIIITVYERCSNITNVIIMHYCVLLLNVPYIILY